MRTAPPAAWCVALVAPDNAVRVPANADVDQVGRLDESGEDTVGAGLVE